MHFILFACVGVCPLYSTVKLREWRIICARDLLRRLEQILTRSVSILLLLGTCSIHTKRNLTSWTYLEDVCEEALEV